jgi:exo-beta-1,3-glucanase (GH17 family)
MAGFSSRTPIRIEETGWPTGAGRSLAAQNRALQAIVGTVNAFRGTYHITDLRWFDLRDNNSRGMSVESHFGLLRDDYSPKPAFTTYRRLITRWGAPAPAARHR